MEGSSAGLLVPGDATQTAMAAPEINTRSPSSEASGWEYDGGGK